ncbi:MAG: hypothetical protein WCF12_05155 [Propionicimonas sp.]
MGRQPLPLIPYAPPPPGNPFTGGQLPPGGQPGKSRLPLILGSVVGLLIIAAVGVFTLRGLANSPAAAPFQSGAPTVRQTDTAAHSVQGYLEALASGDAAGALGYALTAPADTSLLTDEMLAKALAESPITAIQVTAAGSGSTQQTVLASYQLGSTRVNAAYALTESGGQWLLDNVAAEIDVSYLDLGTIALVVNGVTLNTDRPSLFPGTYTLTTASKRLAVRDGSFVIESPDSQPDLYSVGFKLTKSGRAELIKAAQATLRRCLANREAAPKGCGFGLKAPKGVAMSWSTLRWRVRSGANALASIKPSLEDSDPGRATAAVTIKVRGDVDSKDGRSWYGTSEISTVNADLTGATIIVRFG